MSVQLPGRWPVDSRSTAEVLFLCVLIWMLSGPLSGAVLSIHTAVFSLFAKSAYKVESTRDLVTQLLQASQRLKTLEKQLADTQLELTRVKQVSKDAEHLRELLGLRSKLGRQTIAADVITRNPDNWYQELTIDKGTLDHVTLGSAVITNRAVVGQVVKVSKSASVVRLLTDPAQKLGVEINRINQPGVLSGRYQEPAIIDFVPVGTPVDVGDQVVTLGNGGVFPSGHPVGVVSAISRDENGTTLRIQVRLTDNLYDLTQVLVLPPKVL